VARRARVRQESVAGRWKLPPFAANHGAVTATATAEETSPATAPTAAYTASLAVITRPRSGLLRKVSVIVPCRYSPATAKMPKMSVNSAARATCASALLCTAGSCTFPPDWIRPVIPATTRSGPAASSSHGPRTVLSLRHSLRIRGSTAGLLGRSRLAGSRGGGAAIPAAGHWPWRSADGLGQLEEGRLQRVAGRADVAECPGEAHLPRADDHHMVGGLGDLAEHVAGDDHGPPVVGEATQQSAEPGDTGRVEPVGR